MIDMTIPALLLVIAGICGLAGLLSWLDWKFCPICNASRCRVLVNTIEGGEVMCGAERPCPWHDEEAQE